MTQMTQISNASDGVKDGFSRLIIHEVAKVW